MPEPWIDGSTFASDMTALVNSAHRVGVGDLVWLGYQPQNHEATVNENYPKVKFGSQLIACTRQAAERIHRVFSQSLWKPGHTVEMLKFCWDARWCSGVASCVYPPSGSYKVHQSECCPEVGTRENNWQTDWVSGGTRPEHDVKKRNKCIWKFQMEKGGYQQKMCEMKLGDFDDLQKTKWTSWWDPALELWTVPDTGRMKRIQSRQNNLVRKRRHWVAEESKVVACRRTVSINPFRHVNRTE